MKYLKFFTFSLLIAFKANAITVNLENASDEMLTVFIGIPKVKGEFHELKPTHKLKDVKVNQGDTMIFLAMPFQMHKKLFGTGPEEEEESTKKSKS